MSQQAKIENQCRSNISKIVMLLENMNDIGHWIVNALMRILL